MFDLFISELSAERCDELMFRHVNRDWQDDELGLMRSKWFDYRYLHPVIATYTYALAFEQVHGRIVREFLGGGPRKVFKSYDLFGHQADRATTSGVWRGRQHADAIGVPYETYIDLAMRARLAYWQRTSMPRPQHLYSEMIVEKVTEAWEELQAGRLFYGSHEEFRTHRFVGTSPQLDHHEWLFAQAGKRANAAAIMGRFVNEDLIPADKVVARLGEASRAYLPH